MPVINDLVDGGIPGIGHNSGNASLAELLVEETADLQKEAVRLVAGARRAIVVDLDTAKRATTLVGMMIDHGKAIEAAREGRKKPYLVAGRTIDTHFGQLRAELVGTDAKLGGEAARVKCLIDAYYDEEERKAAIERQKYEEEARRKVDEAAAAQRELEEAERQSHAAALAGDVQGAIAAAGSRLDAELRERQLGAEARRLSERAGQARVAPIDTGVGVKAHRKPVYKAVISDWTLALRHARKVNEAAVREIVQAIYDRQVRAGVRSLPGAEIVEDRQTIIRRA